MSYKGGASVDEPEMPFYYDHKHPLYKLGRVILPVLVGGVAGLAYVIMNSLG